MNKPSLPKARIFVFSNDYWNLANYRGNLIAALSDKYEVQCFAPKNNIGLKTEIELENFTPVKFSRDFSALWLDVWFLLRMFAYLLTKRPDCVLTYTVKPNVYLGFVCKVLRIPQIANVTGLGKTGEARKNGLFDLLYRLSNHSKKTHFFQNRGDYEKLKAARVGLRNYGFLPGSGVETSKFTRRKKHSFKRPHLAYVGRLIEDKGVLDVLEAVPALESKGYKVSIAGPKEAASSAGFKQAFERLTSENENLYVGPIQDVNAYLEDIDCLVFPSYYNEGLPRIILESGSKGIPVVCCNIPATEQIIVHGQNGYFCLPQSSESILEMVAEIFENGESHYEMLCQNITSTVTESYDESVVIDSYFKEIERIIHHDVF